MTWVRLDDQFAQHPKLMDVGPLGIAMQVAALCYCARQLTDGFVSRRAVVVLCSFEGVNDDSYPDGSRGDVGWTAIETSRRLVDAGLWEEVDGGYQIHDYHDYQPSREQVLTERTRERDKKRRARGSNATSPKVSPGDSPPGIRRDTVGDNHGESSGVSGRPRTRTPKASSGSPAVDGRANGRTTSTSVEEERVLLADEIVGVLQRGIDGLQTEEQGRPPTRAAILAALKAHDVAPSEVREIADEVRSVAQSQDRAPNIAALFAQRLERHADMAALGARAVQLNANAESSA